MGSFFPGFMSNPNCNLHKRKRKRRERRKGKKERFWSNSGKRGRKKGRPPISSSFSPLFRLLWKMNIHYPFISFSLHSPRDQKRKSPFFRKYMWRKGEGGTVCLSKSRLVWSVPQRRFIWCNQPFFQFLALAPPPKKKNITHFSFPRSFECKKEGRRNIGINQVAKSGKTHLLSPIVCRGKTSLKSKYKKVKKKESTARKKEKKGELCDVIFLRAINLQ